MMQPVNVTCWAWADALCACVDEAERDVPCVDVVLCPFVAPDVLVLCAPTSAVHPTSTAITAGNPARFMACVLLVRIAKSARHRAGGVPRSIRGLQSLRRG